MAIHWACILDDLGTSCDCNNCDWHHGGGTVFRFDLRPVVWHSEQLVSELSWSDFPLVWGMEEFTWKDTYICCHACLYLSYSVVLDSFKTPWTIATGSLSMRISKPSGWCHPFSSTRGSSPGINLHLYYLYSRWVSCHPEALLLSGETKSWWSQNWQACFTDTLYESNW